jgi:hypothetical protein
VRSEATESGLVPVVLLVLLVGLLIAALRGRGRPRRAAALLLLPASAAWVLFNGPIEGPILVTLSPDHGLTVSDLLAVLGVLVAGGVLLLRDR